MTSNQALKNRQNARESVRKKRDFIHKLKDVPCFDCGGRFPYYCMDFDHRAGEVKLFTIGHSTTKGLQQVLAEIAKCDVVCANCHRKRSHQRRLDGTENDGNRRPE